MDKIILTNKCVTRCEKHTKTEKDKTTEYFTFTIVKNRKFPKKGEQKADYYNCYVEPTPRQMKLFEESILLIGNRIELEGVLQLNEVSGTNYVDPLIVVNPYSVEVNQYKKKNQQKK